MKITYEVAGDITLIKKDVVTCVTEHLDKWQPSANHKETAIQLVDEYEEKIRADERAKVFDECISYFEAHANEVWQHISARDFICDSLEQLKEQK